MRLAAKRPKVVRFRSLAALDALAGSLPCIGKVRFVPTDSERDRERREQVALFVKCEDGGVLRTEIAAKWQTRAVEFIQEMCAEMPLNKAFARTRQLFDDITPQLDDIVAWLLAAGVLEEVPQECC